MKIAFIGTHGVGKTTLCFDLAARLKRLDLGVDIVKEVARACPLPINEDTTLDAQAWILHTQIAEEIAAGTQYEAVICDRSVLDNYAYLVHRIGRRPEYDALVRTWVGTYSGLFKVPVLQEPSFDGTRAVSRTFQMEIDAVIDHLLDAFDVPWHRLDPASRPTWVEDVLRALELPLEPPQIDLFSVLHASTTQGTEHDPERR
ncbi:MAG: ATP-binding protein [Gemmatimonadota bacterium]|nr:ATP-binding protein [Gemmatimonadota bacterium]MDH3366761.1 ATP-binding protein [Gemmatimonadota bacterium]MDH3478220.1 ATP-binding protein [Gemmatimonadota bacterium]MDH3568683.1 ATP-binding protein [Gemmatimonadota bacterium]MDH5549017.1 ATP-binding protein [Gemmatimonadota bacterium]